MLKSGVLNKKRLKLDFWFFVKIGIFLVLLLFLVYPFASLIYRSFFSGKVDGITLYNYQRFFSKEYYFRTLFNSLEVSFLPTVTSVLIGVPMAYAMTRYNVAGKKLVYILIVMSLMSPPFIGAYSWIMLFGRAGWVTKLFAAIGISLPTIYGKGGIVMVFTLKLFPYVYLYVAGAMSSIDSSLEEAAENLGSSRLRRLFTVTLPVVLPSIAAGAIMVFMSALADFGTPMLLGEGYMVLPVLVYNEYMSEIGGNAYMASAMSVIIVLCSTGLLLLQKAWVEKRNYVMTAMRPPKEIELRGGKRLLVSLPIWLVVLASFLPQIVVLYCSFRNTTFAGFAEGFGITSYETIAKRLSTNIRNTFVFSGVAIVLIVILGMLISYIIARRKGASGRLMDILIMFPYVIPGSVLGICLIVAFNKRPLILVGTAAILIISFVVRKLPYTVRSGAAFLQQTDPSVEEASISLGVSPVKTFFTVTARMMAPGILSGAILSWITCINEISSSVMLYGGKTSTIAVAIYTEVVRNSYGTAAALASILTVSTALSLLLFMKLSKGKVSVV